MTQRGPLPKISFGFMTKKGPSDINNLSKGISHKIIREDLPDAFLQKYSCLNNDKLQAKCTKYSKLNEHLETVAAYLDKLIKNMEIASQGYSSQLSDLENSNDELEKRISQSQTQNSEQNPENLQNDLEKLKENVSKLMQRNLNIGQTQIPENEKTRIYQERSLAFNKALESSNLMQMYSKEKALVDAEFIECMIKMDKYKEMQRETTERRNAIERLKKENEAYKKTIKESIKPEQRLQKLKEEVAKMEQRKARIDKLKADNRSLRNEIADLEAQPTQLLDILFGHSAQGDAFGSISFGDASQALADLREERDALRSEVARREAALKEAADNVIHVMKVMLKAIDHPRGRIPILSD